MCLHVSTRQCPPWHHLQRHRLPNTGQDHPRSPVYEFEHPVRHRRRAPDGALKIYLDYLCRHYYSPLFNRFRFRRPPLAHWPPFRPKAEASINCWTSGHRTDVCIEHKSALCYHCGQIHERVESPTCVPCCILCKEDHVTGSCPCKLHFNRSGPSPASSSNPQPPAPAPPTGPILKSSLPSRPCHRSTSRGARPSSHHHSVSFPPLPRPEASTARANTHTTTMATPPGTGIASAPFASLLPLLLLSRTSQSGRRPFWQMSALLHPHSLQRHTALRQTAVCCTFGRFITRSTTDGRPRNIIAACASVWPGSRWTWRSSAPLFYNNRGEGGQMCDHKAGNLGLRDTLPLLSVLFDSTHTKPSQLKDVSLLLHCSSLTDTGFLATLRDRYLCIDLHTPLPAYSGSSNSDLDADISCTNNTCGANFRPATSLLLHVLSSSTPERTRRPAAYVAAQSLTKNTYFTPARHICPLPLGTSEVRSSGRLLCPAPDRTWNFGWSTELVLISKSIASASQPTEKSTSSTTNNVSTFAMMA
ncbi:hypothetical protein HPB51_016521 [Rhipicephalus microplus]|uniref:Uncharacterized protein n=1 Tax=Rhipicephalus microplus TaxID=6941 RepID=A0A9J6E2Z8_RHIMP|nr:hypothetical protein HPB51_016521 [Rhipicephalus microplus]